MITRTNINEQIRQAAEDANLDAEFTYIPDRGGRMVWIIDGVTYTPGEAADKLLPDTKPNNR